MNTKFLFLNTYIWTFWNIFVALYFGGSDMEWWKTLLIALIPTIVGSTITCITTYRLSKKSQINSNTEALNNLSKKLGVFEGRSLENTIGVNSCDKSISAQLGVETNTKSISAQIGVGNNDVSLSHASNTILSILEAKEKEEKDKMYKFNKKQKDMKEKIDDIFMIFKDWESVSLKNRKLEKEIEELKAKNAELEHELGKNIKPIMPLKSMKGPTL